ncbi:MAG: CDGSH iron-sulfur domain-containing protein [Alphaproteobacteria bacterium]|jgi:CDGSH-type Zn-finger protein|nr:CDGSH iron-sulfur domain-containing protein [Alphaproteobacteria bacterium]MDP6833067.1 CDGSH iron-sulfur domain-containing protein [Alphaproteobacteria bacterium]MDP6873740.1 CDGSH iron-sulfur domain-containing protein [Alphaproteobacteria bacterium]
MSEAVIAQPFPYMLELQAGKDYFWCTCGKSAKQPFCDGAHKEEGTFAPAKFQVEETKNYALCGCKRNDGKPFCNGAHKNL